MFAGFKSRCTMPRSCAASSASAICRAMASTSLNGIGPSRNPIGQRWPIHQFEDERERAARFLESVDLRDVRMTQGGQEFGFALEPGQAIRIGGEGFRQDLDRDIALQTRVACLVHLAHSPCADGGEDVVWADTRAGR